MQEPVVSPPASSEQSNDGWPIDTRLTTQQQSDTVRSTPRHDSPTSFTNSTLDSKPSTSLAPPMEDFPALSPKTSPRPAAVELSGGSWSGVVNKIVELEEKTHVSTFKPTIRQAIQIKDSAVFAPEFVPSSHHYRSSPPAPLLTTALHMQRASQAHEGEDVSPSVPLKDKVPVARTNSFPPPWANLDKIPDWSETYSPMFTPSSPQSQWGT